MIESPCLSKGNGRKSYPNAKSILDVQWLIESWKVECGRKTNLVL